MSFQLTLRFRIISFVALLSIILIAAFTALLIARQLHVITENNLYRARVGTYAAKGVFERSILSAERTGGDPTEAIQGLVPALQEGKLAEEVTVADASGKVVASTQPLQIGGFLEQRDLYYAEVARKTYSRKNWFHAEVEPGAVSLYVPLTLNGHPRYAAVFRYSLGNMADAVTQVAKLCMLVALGVAAVVVPLCLLLIRTILGPIRILNEATKDIAAGNLSLKVHVPTEDELGELAQTFNRMTSALLRMKQRAEGANPLTKLPGNNAIYEEIERRIRAGEKFVALYADIDNFKAFNDAYGIAEGDRAIKITAEVLRETLHRAGGGGFLGHEGGDDFMVILPPDRAEAAAAHLCSEFDKRIRQLYTEADLARGHIVSMDREGNVKRFPIMTISLAGVTNVHRPLSSYAEVTNIFAGVKKRAKQASQAAGKSSFLLDQRKEPEETAQKPTGVTASPAAPTHPPAAGSPSHPPAPPPDR